MIAAESAAPLIAAESAAAKLCERNAGKCGRHFNPQLLGRLVRDDKGSLFRVHRDEFDVDHAIFDRFEHVHFFGVCKTT
ncbi:hypothetical protein M4951_25545 [Blastopirellula sp. J2-11]|nr:hypothetical protein M4951_25545 [Blastopirellula sp. J2-11]